MRREETPARNPGFRPALFTKPSGTLSLRVGMNAELGAAKPVAFCGFVASVLSQPAIAFGPCRKDDATRYSVLLAAQSFADIRSDCSEHRTRGNPHSKPKPIEVLVYCRIDGSYAGNDAQGGAEYHSS